jgi:uncharacterized membrane protein YdjX (TVP38/TMEM64 family)
LKNKQKPQKTVLFCGLILIAIGIAAAVLLYMLQFDELWHWYEVIKNELALLETQIAHLEDKWLFVAAIFLLFAVKSFIPIYPTPTVCFLTGAMLPMYLSVPVNVVGFCILLTIRYFAGKRFGAGGAWYLLRRYDRLRRLIEQDGNGNSSLLIILRLVPVMPVNSISGIYGSLRFDYWRFILLSVIGYMPKIISYTFVGRNVYDPLSPEFIVPIMIIAFASGISLVCVNGLWRSVENTVRKAKIKMKNKASEKGRAK